MALFIDIGHGGSDPGAVADGANERDELRLALSPVMRHILDIYGAVQVPEYTNIKHTLRARIRWIASAATPVDDLVSLHLNVGPPAASGVEVFYRAGTTAKTRAAELSQYLSKFLGLRNRGAKPDTESYRERLAICRTVPRGYVAECGFLTNTHDLATWRDRGGYAVLAALARWVTI